MRGANRTNRNRFGCRKHAIRDEIREQLETVPMQICVIKHIRKIYGCLDFEAAPVTADKPAQWIEKSMASFSVLAMLQSTRVRRWSTPSLLPQGTGPPGHRYSKAHFGALSHPVQEQFQPLLNVMRDSLLASQVIYCDETRVQVSEESGSEPRSQHWM